MIIKYDPKYRDRVAIAFSGDDFAAEAFFRCADRNPDNTFIALDGSAVLAAASFEQGGIGILQFCLSESCPRSEASLLLRCIFDEIRSAGVSRKVGTDFMQNEKLHGFLLSEGFLPWFLSDYMACPLAEERRRDAAISRYSDADFVEAFTLYVQAFHRMRISVGLEPLLAQPDDLHRQEWLAHAEDIFVMREAGEITAVMQLDRELLDCLAVRIDKQGQGIGRRMIEYALEEQRLRGYSRCGLWCVVGNSAAAVYKRLGFSPVRRHEFMHRMI